jgi:ABC-type sugar transport system permease subunit
MALDLRLDVQRHQLTLKVVSVLGPSVSGSATPRAMAAIVTVHVWRMLPFSTVILLAGLTSIPTEVNGRRTSTGGPLARPSA